MIGLIGDLLGVVSKKHWPPNDRNVDLIDSLYDLENLLEYGMGSITFITQIMTKI